MKKFFNILKRIFFTIIKISLSIIILILLLMTFNNNFDKVIYKTYHSISPYSYNFNNYIITLSGSNNNKKYIELIKDGKIIKEHPIPESNYIFHPYTINNNYYVLFRECQEPFSVINLLNGDTIAINPAKFELTNTWETSPITIDNNRFVLSGYRIIKPNDVKIEKDGTKKEVFNTGKRKSCVIVYDKKEDKQTVINKDRGGYFVSWLPNGNIVTLNRTTGKMTFFNNDLKLIKELDLNLNCRVVQISDDKKYLAIYSRHSKIKPQDFKDIHYSLSHKQTPYEKLLCLGYFVNPFQEQACVLGDEDCSQEFNNSQNQILIINLEKNKVEKYYTININKRFETMLFNGNSIMLSYDLSDCDNKGFNAFPNAYLIKNDKLTSLNITQGLKNHFYFFGRMDNDAVYYSTYYKYTHGNNFKYVTIKKHKIK